MSKQTDNHFFASVVKSKEFIPMYHDVVLWMLKRDMLITLHLRIRVVATRELKLRVKEERDRKILLSGGAVKFHKNAKSGSENGDSSSRTRNASFFLSPRSVRKFARRISSNESGKSEISELNFDTDETMQKVVEEEEASDSDDDNSEVDDQEDSGWDTTEDHLSPSMINDPGKATPMQRRWLSAMSDGKEPAIAKRFEL